MSVTSLPHRADEVAGGRFRRLARSIAGVARRAWTGANDLPPFLKLEQRFIALRFLGILCLAPTLPLLNLSPTRLAAAYGLLLFTVVYNSGIQFLLRIRSHWLDKGYITTIGDGLLNIAMVTIGGGFESPFYFILFTTTIAAAMRYGYGPSMLLVGFYVALDVLSVAATRGAAVEFHGGLLFRSFFLVITSLLGGYLREQARTAEAALARQLERARALNESTRALGASLRLDTVLQTVVVEARRLAGGQEAVLRLGTELGDLVSYDLESAHSAPTRRTEQRRMVLDHLVHDQGVSGEPASIECGTTVDGQRYIVVPLAARGGAAGRIAVVRGRNGRQYTQDEEELLVSFIDRASLAIENASLYKTVGDRSRELHRAYADLAAAHQELLGVDEMKTNFIANVSHELRTPLTSIRSFSELLLSFGVDEVTEREFLGIINAESERLTRLINDVLDITKIEAGQVEWHIEPVPLGEILRSGARTFAPLVEERGLRFRLVLPSSPAMVNADADRVQQVLANLIGNAIKFTETGEIVLAAELVDGHAHILVRDTGVGIDPADHERIFEKFHQVGDALTEKPTGTGLGLCICRDIVAQHGGHIWVESARGQGSTFRFSLPVAKLHDVA